MTSNNTRFLHIRQPALNRNESGQQVSGKGGTTIAYDVDDDTLNFAVAKCSDRDNYCRKTGRAIAEGRLKAGKFRTLVIMNDKPIDAILRNL